MGMGANTRTIKSLVYSYTEEIKSQESVLDTEIISQTEAVLGIRPVLPQPGLTEAPARVLPISMPKEQIIPQVYEQLKMMAREVYESPDSCSSQSDLAGTLSRITMYMRLLSLSELEELDRKVMQESLSGYKTIEKIYSTLKSLAATEIPTLKAVGLKAKTVLPLIKPEIVAIHRSHNINLSTIVEYLNTITSNQFMLVNSKESLVPHHAIFKTKVYGPALTEFGSISFAAYTNGMDTLIEKYLPYIGYATKMSPAVQRQLEQITQELRLKAKEIPTPEAFIQQSVFGIESATFIDSEFVLEALDELSRQLEQQHSFEFTYVSANQIMETTDYGFSAAGLPLMMLSSAPTLVAIKGSVRTESVSPRELLPKITAKVIPVINGKLQSAFGVVSPFTAELIVLELKCPCTHLSL